MKNLTASSSARAPSKSARNVRKGAKIINCSFCHNTFSAVPRDAVCQKCKRPANRPLSWFNRLLCLILFPVGLVQSALLRPSRPFASMQALLLSIVGAALWAALYFLVWRV